MGRRKGSKNRTEEERRAIAEAKALKPKGKIGRPKGSKNKPKEVPVAEEQPRKRTGRPKGSKSGYTVSEKALAQRERNGLNNFAIKVAVSDEAKQYNALLIQHIMRIHEIAAHADRSDLNSLKSCFVAYLQLCQEDGFSVSNISAYSSMGFGSYIAFEQYIKRDDPEIREFGALVKGTCSMFRETMVSANKLNPVIGIFWQRNFDGLRNDTEAVQAAQEQDDEFNNGGKAYKEKYKNLL